MKKFAVEFDRNSRIEKFLDNTFLNSAITYSYKENGRTVEYEFLCDERKGEEIIVTLVSNFYKYKVISNFVNGNKDIDISFFALMGCIVGFDSKEEVKRIKSGLTKYATINLDGFCNFVIPEIKGSWQNLGVLTNRLLKKCVDNDDVYSLCGFFLDTNDKGYDDVIVISGKDIYWEYNKVDVPIIPYTGIEERDMVITLLSKHPSNVVVNNRNAIHREVMSVIKALSE